jgi:hypothetical protein
MPYRKVGDNDYVSPNGTHINAAQNKLWHTLGGRWPGEKKESSVAYAKGGNIQSMSYAAGGPVLGRTRDFLKEPVEFREDDEGERQNKDVVGDTSDEDQKYGKSGAGKGDGCGPGPKAKRTGDKSLKAVKPRG